MSQYCFHDNINSFNKVLNNYTVADDRYDILAWLSPLNPKVRHQDIRDRRVGNVGEWLSQTEEFRRWEAGSEGDESDKAVLFCYGDPGVGKTFISSLVIDRLCDQARGRRVAVACFYFDFAAQKEQSPTSMLGALLKQVVSGLEEIPEEIVQAYKDHKKVIDGRGLQLADIVKMLQTTASEIPTFICIDALDECVAGYRVKVLDSLNQILRRSPGTRVFVTGRPQIQAEVEKRLSRRVMAIRITPRRRDIIGYLHSRLDEDTKPDEMDSSLEAEILKKIPEDVSEIFLLVSLNIDAILQGTTIGGRRQKLYAMTDGLGLEGAYGETLGRIKAQGEEESRLGMAALMWISHAERPLKVDELCHALGVEIGAADLDRNNVPSIKTLLACCQGLVAVDKKASTVRLIHLTLQEYLRGHLEPFGTAHPTIAETCLSYLNSHQVIALSANPSPDFQGIPFLEYSSLYWGMHAKRGLSAYAKQLALKLFEDYSNHISIKLLLDAEKSRLFFIGRDKYSGFSSLHCASFFGIVEMVADLVEVDGCDVNQADCIGSTPLAWAAWKGNEGVAEVLLRRDDVDPNKRCIGDRTPLLCAAWRGHEGVARILLRRDDIRPDEPEFIGRTPLWCAAEYGREGIVKILLERGDVNSGKSDNDGRTPLSVAAQNGHEEIVKILLGRDGVNADKQDIYYRTPLWSAAFSGHEGVVKILLERGNVDPNKPDYDGQTPVWCATENGHEGVVKILLGWDGVNSDKLSNTGQTPLWRAAWNGYESVVKILLERGDVRPNKPDNAGQTPLWCAAWNGHEEVVKILLGSGKFSPDQPDNAGQTPLWCAAWNGHEGVVKILLGLEDVDPGKPNGDGITPLHGAAFWGHEGVMRILLGRDDVNPDRPDRGGQTPRSLAASSSHAGVVALLSAPASAARSTA